MINLLPKEYSQELKNEYLRRLLSVFVIFIGSIVIMGIIMLIPTFIFLLDQKTSLDAQLTFLNKKLSESNSKETLEAMNDINDKLAIVDVKNKPEDFGNIVTKITNTKGADIKIKAISYIKAQDKKQKDKISLTGYSTNRQTLLAFIENLKKVFPGASVQSPVSNILKEKNLDFSIIIEK